MLSPSRNTRKKTRTKTAKVLDSFALAKAGKLGADKAKRLLKHLCFFEKVFLSYSKGVCVCMTTGYIYIYVHMYKYICIYIYMYMLTCIYIYKCLVVLEVTPCQYIFVYIWRVEKSCCCYRNHPLKITDMFEYMSSLVNHPCFPINTLFFLHNHHKRAWRPIVLF